MRREALDKTVEAFLSKPLPKRQKIQGLNPDRADIITAGALVLREVMDLLKAPDVMVSLNGLREGVFFEHFWEHLAYPVIPDVRQFSVLNLARVYDYQKAHVNHVRFLGGRLFDQLQPLHHLGGSEKELLDAAASLHDLGPVIGYEDHHKHSHTLIDTNGLPGYFTQGDRTNWAGCPLPPPRNPGPGALQDDSGTSGPGDSALSFGDFEDKRVPGTRSERRCG